MLLAVAALAVAAGCSSADDDGSPAASDSPASASSSERALLDAIAGSDAAADNAVADILAAGDERFVAPFIELLRIHELAWISR